MWWLEVALNMGEVGSAMKRFHHAHIDRRIAMQHQGSSFNILVQWANENNLSLEILRYSYGKENLKKIGHLKMRE